MRIDQRNAGAAVLNVNGYTVDRFTAGYYGGATGRFTAERSTTAPAGFTNSLLLTTTTAQAVLGANDAFAIRQAIEGFNVADLFFGESSAQTVTLSFWVRSSQTGTFSVLLLNAAGDRCYGGLVTINAANTFEYKTVTIPGDTTGTWLKDSSAGIQVYFGLGAGSTRTVAAGWSNGAGGATPGAVTGQTINICASVGANFRVTGVQLEVGSKASAFERRPYGMELALCQRYYEMGEYTFAVTNNLGSTLSGHFINFKVEKRGTPTIVATDIVGNANRYSNYNRSSFARTDNFGGVTVWGAAVRTTAGFIISANTTTSGEMFNPAGLYTASAEL